MYYSKVLWPLHETVIENGVAFVKEHDDSLLILPKYCDLGIRTIDYLRKNKIAKASIFKDQTISALQKIINSAQ